MRGGKIVEGRGIEGRSKEGIVGEVRGELWEDLNDFS